MAREDCADDWRRGIWLLKEERLSGPVKEDRCGDEEDKGLAMDVEERRLCSLLSDENPNFGEGINASNDFVESGDGEMDLSNKISETQ